MSAEVIDLALVRALREQVKAQERELELRMNTNKILARELKHLRAVIKGLRDKIMLLQQERG